MKTAFFISHLLPTLCCFLFFHPNTLSLFRLVLNRALSIIIIITTIIIINIIFSFVWLGDIIIITFFVFTFIYLL